MSHPLMKSSHFHLKSVFQNLLNPRHLSLSFISYSLFLSSVFPLNNKHIFAHSIPKHQ